MKEFDYKKYEKEYEEALDWIIDVVAENANPKKFEDKMILEAHVNDYVRYKYDYLSKEEQDEVIDEVVKQYYLL